MAWFRNSKVQNRKNLQKAIAQYISVLISPISKGSTGSVPCEGSQYNQRPAPIHTLFLLPPTGIASCSLTGITSRFKSSISPTTTRLLNYTAQPHIDNRPLWMFLLYALWTLPCTILVKLLSITDNVLLILCMLVMLLH